MKEATDLLSKIITKLAEDISKSIFEKAKNYFVDREIKDQIDIGSAYEDYLSKIYDTYSKSKTIFYGDKARKLSSFFVPVDIAPLTTDAKLRKFGDDITKDISIRNSTKDITSIVELGNKLIITGTGGMGKTMLMKHFCTNAIESGYKIPIFISLRRFNNVNIDNIPFEKLVYDQIKVFGFELNYDYFEYSLTSDRYIFLFDGFDEVNEIKRARISVAIADFAIHYSKNSFIVSSRLIDDLFGWDDFKLFQICPLTLEQTVDLIWELDYEEEVKKRFTRELTTEMYLQYKPFATVPLLLSILFITYKENTELPKTLDQFYDTAFEKLFYQHDRAKRGFKREYKSKLSYLDFKKLFFGFCYLSFFKEMYQFSYEELQELLSTVSTREKLNVDVEAFIEDLVSITCMLIHDGDEYIFIHRNFQEYFAAVYVSSGSEEKQSLLISKLLNTSYNEESLHKVYLGNLEMDHFESFLISLQRVEPKKFELIVLFPILEKVHSAYLESKFDLLYTTVKTFDTYESRKGVSRLYKKLPNSELTLKEKKILSLFYTNDVFTWNITSSVNKGMVRKIEELTSKKYFNYVFRKRATHGKLYSIHREVSYSDYCFQIRMVAFMIERYELICEKKQKEKEESIDEFILDFI